jgi:hypothetical protein
MHSIIRSHFAAAMVATFVLTGALSPAAQFTYTLLADNTVMSPAGSTFTHVWPPAVADGQVAFCGDSASVTRLVKGMPGSYALLASVGDTVPGTTYTLSNFSSTLVANIPVVSMNGGNVVCNGQLSAPGAAIGLYAWRGGVMERGIDQLALVPIPSSPYTFEKVGMPTVAGSTVCFSGGTVSLSAAGIYTSNTTTLARLVDLSTPIPGGSGNFTNFGGRVGLYNGTAAFTGFGSGSQKGAYTSDGSVVTRIADNTTIMPGASVTFNSFLGIGMSSGGVTILGGGDVVMGIYTTIGGTLTRVVDNTMDYPGGTGKFMFQPYSSPKTAPLATDGNSVVFLARDQASKEGIFLWRGGTIMKIVESGSTFEGGYVYNVDMGPCAIEGNSIGFQITTSAGGGYRNFLATYGGLPPSAAARDWENYR